jgi:hypothetical protein
VEKKKKREREKWGRVEGRGGGEEEGREDPSSLRNSPERKN